VHKPLVIDGDPERIEAHLPMIHIAFSNLKSWLLEPTTALVIATCRHTSTNLCSDFNRRFYPMTAFNFRSRVAAHASAPTYKNSTAATGRTRLRDLQRTG